MSNIEEQSINDQPSFTMNTYYKVLDVNTL
jgi:hypothetical protein